MCSSGRHKHTSYIHSHTQGTTSIVTHGITRLNIYTEGIVSRRSYREFITSHRNILTVLILQDWSDDDLSLCLQESRGELDTAITRISEGHASKFGEVTKKKDKTAKRVEHSTGRGRGRGATVSRGRSETRGRGRGRGASVVSTNGNNKPTESNPSWPTETTTAAAEDIPAWAEDAAPKESSAPATGWSSEKAAVAATPQAANAPSTSDLFASKPKSKIIDKNSKSSWASIAKPVVTEQKKSTTGQKSSTSNPAPLTEENLEHVNEAQPNLPQPPAATVASLINEPATGPSSQVGVSDTLSVGPPGLKSGTGSAARGNTPVGARRLMQNQAVVMPNEREPSSRLGVQFGSLGLNDEDPSDRLDSQPRVPKKQDVRDLPGEMQARQEPSQHSRSDKPYDNFNPAYGGYGGPAPQQQHPGYGQAHDQYAGMTNFYNEPARPSSFAGQSDYYQSQQGATQAYGAAPAGASQRSDSTTRPSDSRMNESASSPMTSITSQQGPHSASSPSLHGGPQHGQYPMHPQYGQPNPYAYYGYGYGYPQQQSAYAPMYGQRGYGAQSQYQAPHVHQSAGTSQDRFERSTAEYQRQQQQQPAPGSFANTDFLGSSRQHEELFKGYNGTPRDDNKQGAASFGHYGAPQSSSPYEQQPQQPGPNQNQGQFSQYGSFGRGSTSQQYGWNQGY